MPKSELIHYDREQKQWCLQKENRSYRLHYGECFDLYIGNKAYPCRLELDTDWYVILAETKFALHSRTIYHVKM